MIPIRDIQPRVRVPLVNYLVIAASIAAFFYELSLGKRLGGLIDELGFRPVELYEAFASGDRRRLLAPLADVGTSMFLHGGWFHVVGNLLYLRVFGDNVEDRLGHVRFFVFYALSGLAGAVGQTLADPGSGVPMIGASGAVAGVLGAYIVLFPRARVLTLFPVFVILTFIEVPAFVFLGLWGLQQFLNGYLVIAAESGGGGVAWFAHIGGFAFGLVVGAIARLRRWR